jgi:hypothetical protein
MIGDSNPGRGWEFVFTTESRPTLGPTQPPIQWVAGVLSLGVKRPGVKLTTHLNLVPRSRMRGAIPPLPQYACVAWCSVKAQGQLYLSFSHVCIHLSRLKCFTSLHATNEIRWYETTLLCLWVLSPELLCIWQSVRLRIEPLWGSWPDFSCY